MADEDQGTTIEILPVTTLGVERPDVPARKKDAPRGLHIVCWVFFGVGFAWVPFLVDLLAGSESSPNLSLATVLSHGELLLVSAVITAGALGDLIVGIVYSENQVTVKVLTAGILMLNFAVTAMYYAVLRFEGGPPVSESQHIATTSLWFFGFSFVTSLVSLLIAEYSE